MKNNLGIDESELCQRFPRASLYAAEWINEGAMGGNPLWQTEWLCEEMALAPGMRVLDLGCGRAKSSIFLAREFGVEVWAADLWIAAAENWQRVRDAGLEDRVFPIHADARALPFAGAFFDAVIAVDCYSYFGTDDLYLNYLAHFVKPGGRIGIAGAGLTQEMPVPVPAHLVEMWTQDAWCLHSLTWWRQHWERTRIVEITAAGDMPDGWRLWAYWHRLAWPNNTTEIAAVEADQGRYLTYIRLVGRCREDATLVEYAWPDQLRSLPVQYERRKMLREA